MLGVKYWARQRGINDASNGTLSSYAWAIMVLHYLQRRTPPVIPSLTDPALLKQAEAQSKLLQAEVEGYEVEFCNDAELVGPFVRARTCVGGRTSRCVCTTAPL